MVACSERQARRLVQRGLRRNLFVGHIKQEIIEDEKKETRFKPQTGKERKG